MKQLIAWFRPVAMLALIVSSLGALTPARSARTEAASVTADSAVFLPLVGTTLSTRLQPDELMQLDPETWGGPWPVDARWVE